MPCVSANQSWDTGIGSSVCPGRNYAECTSSEEAYYYTPWSEFCTWVTPAPAPAPTPAPAAPAPTPVPCEGYYKNPKCPTECGLGASTINNTWTTTKPAQHGGSCPSSSTINCPATNPCPTSSPTPTPSPTPSPTPPPPKIDDSDMNMFPVYLLSGISVFIMIIFIVLSLGNKSKRYS